MFDRLLYIELSFFPNLYVSERSNKFKRNTYIDKVHASILRSIGSKSLIG